MGLHELALTLGGGLVMGILRMPAQIALLVTGLLVAWFSARVAYQEGDWYVMFLTMFQWPIEALIGWGMGQGLSDLSKQPGNIAWILAAGVLFSLWLHFLFFPPIMHPIVCGLLDFIEVDRPRCL